MAALFFDIDGTLISDESGSMSESTRKGLLKARENGHQIFINSGRTLCDVPEEMKEFPFDGYCCGCGTHLLYHGKTLMKHSVPLERCGELISLIQEYGVEATLEGTEDVYFQKAPYRFGWLEDYRVHMQQERGLGLSVYLEEKNCQFDKFILYAGTLEDRAAFFKKLEPDMIAIPCGKDFYECVQKAYSKATAIAFFQEYLGITLDEVYVFGDSDNDEAMFAYAKHTIALKKHTPALEPLTEYVTDTVENDGIYKALVHYGLLEV